MKNSLRHLTVILLTTVGTLIQNACGPICHEWRYFGELEPEIIELQNAEVKNVYLIDREDYIQLALAGDLNNHTDEFIKFDFIDSFVGETATVNVNQVIRIGNAIGYTSNHWEGTATLEITRIDKDDIDYKYTLDIKSGDSTIKFEGIAKSVVNKECRERGPS